MILAAALVVLLQVTALAVPAHSAGSRQATPAFWTAEKDGKVLYLLGSVHMLPADMKWMRSEIEQARSRSHVFVFEAPLQDAQAGMASFVEREGKLPEGRTLRHLLSSAEYEQLERAAWSVQYPPRLLSNLRPWLASVYLELYAYLKLGFSPYYGVDQVMDEYARTRRASFAYLETIEEQLSYFSALSPQAELAYLKSTIQDVLADPDAPKQLIDAWASGDTQRLSRLIEDGFNKIPSLRQNLLTARNKKWVPQLIEMMKSSKVHFVTVGAGHLVGSDSVVALLAKQGYKITGP